MKRKSHGRQKGTQKQFVLITCICLLFVCTCLLSLVPEEGTQDNRISIPASGGADESFELPEEPEEMTWPEASRGEPLPEKESQEEAPGAEQLPPDLTASCAQLTPSDLAPYSGNAYITINDNVPYFSDSDLRQTASFEFYSPLDSLGRCGVVYACIGQDLMPTEERGEVGQLKPTGWHTVKYNDYIDQNYLYNRCHLIGYQLTGNNSDARNLITGTRYLNVEGMLPFENQVADYVRESGSHVLYRVTPLFEGDDLLAGGVLMEARSVEDEGEGIEFCVYCYNVQPNIVIDYADGSSRLDESLSAAPEPTPENTQVPATPEPTPENTQVPNTPAPSSENTQTPNTPAPTPENTQTPATPAPTPENTQTPATPAPTPEDTPAPAPSDQSNAGKYAVNAKNGKIHITGECPATGDGENAMTKPVYFDTYEEAEAYSIQSNPGQKKRKCGNCW